MTAPALPRGGTRAKSTTGGVLEARLDEERSGLTTRFQSAQALFTIAPLIVAMAVFAVALGDGRWMAWPRAIPMLFWALAAAGAYAAFRWHSRFFPELRSTSALAGTVEQEQALRAGSLRGALEVGGEGVLGAFAAADVARRLSPTALAPQLGSRLRRVQLWGVGAAVLSIGVLWSLGRVYPDGLAAAMHPIRAWRGTLLPALGFDKLPTSVPRGMPLTVRVRAEGRHAVTLSRRAAGESWRDTTLDVDATGMASLALGPVRAPVTLRVHDGRAPEVQAVVAVDERGWIGDVTLFAEYPAYLARSNETLEPVSPVRVPRGTRVRVTAVLRGGARDAALSDGASSVSLVAGGAADVADGERVSGVLPLDHDGTWTWSAMATPRTVGGTLPPELPDSLSFVVVPDKAPEVIIDAPASDTAIGSTGVVPVLVRAGDDHGVSRVALTLWREAAKSDAKDQRAAPRERLEIGDPGAPFFEGGVTVSLDGRGLEPGDRLHLVAIATDDSPWRQQTSSSEVILRVPTLTEQRSMARSLADSLAARALQMAQQEKRLQQNTADASRSRDLKNGGRGEEQPGGAKTDGSKSAMSFQAAEKARELARQQQQMGAKVDSLRQSAKELENRLKSANALDTALASRMRDIQKMLRDAMTPEMQKQLEALNKSTERLSGTEAQQSMEQLAQQQQQMRQQLEKSAEMLKRAALEGSMSTLRDDAKELADAQKKLADQLDRKKGAQPPKSGDEDPKALAERSRALQDEVDKLAKRLEEAGAKPGASKTRAAQPMVDQAADAMDRAAREALKDAAERQEQNAKDAKAGEKGEAGKQSETNAAEKAAQALKDDKDKAAPAGQAKQADEKTTAGAASQSGNSSERKPGAQAQGAQGAGQQGGQPQGKQQAGQQGQPQPGQQGQPGQGAGKDARQAGDAMDKAAQQLSSAREAQVDAWKTELSQQLDQSINETAQLARQQAELEQRARQGGDAQSMQGEQGAVQQGVQQAAERLEQAGRSSSLLSQRSQKAMADAQRRVPAGHAADGPAGATRRQRAGAERHEGRHRGAQPGAQFARARSREGEQRAVGVGLHRDDGAAQAARAAAGCAERTDAGTQPAPRRGAGRRREAAGARAGAAAARRGPVAHRRLRRRPDRAHRCAGQGSADARAADGAVRHRSLRGRAAAAAVSAPARRRPLPRAGRA